MTYYHVLIESISKLTKKLRRHALYDISEETVRTSIAEPYMNNEEFMIGGTRIDPEYVESIRIIETRNTINEIAKDELFGTQHLIRKRIIEGSTGEDATNYFIKSLPKKKNIVKTKRATPQLSKNVFIVHGRDHEPMKELKALLIDLGFNPIVLHEQAGGSRTIVEKLEKYSDVGYAFVILTPDDIGVSFQTLFEKTAKCSYDDEALGAAKRILEQSRGSIERFIEFNDKFMQDPADAAKFLQFLIPRARQNVVLEFGYFMGLLGRDSVCCLYKGDIKLPSDMHGIVYLPFKKSVNEAKSMILKELREAGYEIESSP